MCKVLSSIPSTVRQKQNKEARLQNLVTLTISKLIMLAKSGLHGMHQPYIWSLSFQLLQIPHSPKFVFYVKHFRMCILLITISQVIFCTVYRYLKLAMCDNLYGCIVGKFYRDEKDWVLLPTTEVQNKTILCFCIFLQFPCRLFLFYQFSGFSKKSVYLKLVMAHIPGCRFLFSNLYRFIVFAFVKV